MEKCLKMAGKDGVSSIAFPTVGCGRLKFDPKSVARSFIQAQRNTQSTVQVVCYFLCIKRRDFSNFLPRDAMHKRGLCRHAVSVCVSVCLSRSCIVSKRIKISSKFFHRRAATPF